jgi:hypothetical protein
MLGEVFLLQKFTFALSVEYQLELSQQRLKRFLDICEQIHLVLGQNPALSLTHQHR